MTSGTPPNTPTLSTGDLSANHTPSPPPSEPLSPGAVTDVFAAFEDQYSPSAPEIVYEGDWSDFLDFSLFPEEPAQDVRPTTPTLVAPSPESPINFDACAEALSAERTLSDGFIDFGTDDWTAFFGSEDFLTWYDAEVAKGTFDSCIYAEPVGNAQASSSSGAGTISPCMLKAESTPKLDVCGAIELVATCYDTDNDEDDDIWVFDPVYLKKQSSNDHPDGDGQSQAVGSASNPCRVDAEVSRMPAMECADLHDIKILEEFANDSSEEEEDTRPQLFPDGIHRHYWHKNNLKYTFIHNCRKYYMTAEAMASRFQGVPYAIFKYWDGKRAGTISATRIMEYFATHGHLGPFREPLYRFLPRRLYRLLMEDKGNFFF